MLLPFGNPGGLQSREWVPLRAKEGATPNSAAGMARLVHPMSSWLSCGKSCLTPSWFLTVGGGGIYLFANMMNKNPLPRNMQTHFLCKLLPPVCWEPCAPSKPPVSHWVHWPPPAQALFWALERWWWTRHGSWGEQTRTELTVGSVSVAQCWKAELELGLVAVINRAIAMGKGSSIRPHRKRIRVPNLLPGHGQLKTMYWANLGKSKCNLGIMQIPFPRPRKKSWEWVALPGYQFTW